MLVCRDVPALTTDYLESALPRTQRFSMTFHLSICSFCRRHLRQVRATVRLLRQLPMPTPAQAVEDAVMACLAGSQTPDIALPPTG